ILSFCLSCTMYSIRLIQPQDNAQIAKIIREVSVEFGLAAESGFAVGDPILDQLYEVYQQDNAAYWVIVDEQNQVYGGGGIAPLQGDHTILEIQKMYFLPIIRQLGFAKQILHKAFEFSHQQNFKRIYLETTESL